MKSIEFKIEEGIIKDPINYFNVDSWYKKEPRSRTVEEIYSNSDIMQAVAFDFIDALRENPNYESSQYVALRFDDMRVADMFKHWDFSKYQNRMEFYIHPELVFTILVVYAPRMNQ